MLLNCVAPLSELVVLISDFGITGTGCWGVMILRNELTMMPRAIKISKIIIQVDGFGILDNLGGLGNLLKFLLKILGMIFLFW